MSDVSSLASAARRYQLHLTIVGFGLACLAIVLLARWRRPPSLEEWGRSALMEHISTTHPELHVYSAFWGCYASRRPLTALEIATLPAHHERWQGIALCFPDRSDGTMTGIDAPDDGEVRIGNVRLFGDPDVIRVLAESLRHGPTQPAGGLTSKDVR